jgi:two-component system, OmpR family, sensor histidine kinase KdpD
VTPHKDVRPDPEELLRRLQAEEKQEHGGRLKIFLGYASNVGKSLRMFDEGRRRKMRGEDVVVGAVQERCSSEIRHLVDQFEVIPTISQEFHGKICRKIDVASILNRRPRVCLVDGLAYDNPPGSRNLQRWQDVRELVEGGITVVTALNLQHIAEQQDAVAGITGKRAVNSVPGRFIRIADEIELVDAAPKDLMQRGDSSANPDMRRLSALRELALLFAAEVVDEQLQRYLQDNSIEMAFGSQERILVCLTPRSSARKMLESGRRNADRFHCDLLAVYVHSRQLDNREEAAVQCNIGLARSLGAEFTRLEAKESVPAIVEFARGKGITQIFVGHSLEKEWRTFFTRNTLDRLINAAEGMDVRVFPHADEP